MKMLRERGGPNSGCRQGAHLPQIAAFLGLKLSLIWVVDLEWGLSIWRRRQMSRRFARLLVITAGEPGGKMKGVKRDVAWHKAEEITQKRSGARR